MRETISMDSQQYIYKRC